MLWDGQQSELETFLIWLNSRDEKLPFTSVSNMTSLQFLDVKITRQDNQWSTSVYRKPTDRNTLLHYQIAHPRKLKDGLPFSQFLRYRRNCSDIRDYKTQAIQLKEKFRERGYPSRVIDQAYKRALFNNRESLLTPTPRTSGEDNKVNLITTYSPYSYMIQRIIKKHSNVLQSTSVLEDKTIRCVWKRHKNLKEILSPTVLRPLKSTLMIQDKGHYKCGNCAICQITEECTFFHYRDKKYHLQHRTTCTLTYVVYCIRCPCQLI